MATVKKRLKPRKSIVRGKEMWRVDILPGDSGGKRQRKYFSDEVSASEFIQDHEKANAERIEDWLQLPPNKQAALVRILGKLDGDVMALDQAADDYLKKKDSGAKSRTLKEAYDEMMTSREGSNLRENYMANLRSVLKMFLIKREHTECREITATTVETWLNGQGLKPTTRQGYLQKLRSFFLFAMKRKYCDSNPAAAVPYPAHDDKPPTILKVDDCAKLLHACQKHDARLIPYLCVSLFAGLRPMSEAKHLLWENIRGDMIEVKSRKIRTRGRRFVHLQPVLKAWLAFGGDFPIVNLPKRVVRVKKLAGVAIPQDALRHSFASYHLAHFKSPDKTAHEMGHRSTDILYGHYRELVTPEDAARFWNLFPSLIHTL